MGKCYIQNLAMIVTNKCNLDCAHCLRGKKNNSCISDKVIEATLDQVKVIGNLAINGGEPTLVIDRLEKIISYIIEKHIKIEEFTVTINGTIYSKELLELLDEIDNYIGEDTVSALFAISLDKYHLDEIEKMGILKQFLENLDKYRENKHFYCFRNFKQKLFREGNAVNLDEKLSVELRPMKTLLTYVGKKGKLDIENGFCGIGPVITVNTDGIITECDASIKNQETIYNYGNVLSDSIEEICIKNGSPILKPRKFEKETYKILKKYWTYNR